MENGNFLFLNEEYLKKYREELLEFLEDQDYMKSLSFAKRMMMSQEIKSNNAIEGIKDDLSIIQEVIKRRKIPISEEEKTRIINLYHGYQYILTHKRINQNSLKELYSVLSKNLLQPSDAVRMGDFYRTAPVYILKNNRLDLEPFRGLNEKKLDEYMNQFFEYINSDCNFENEIDVFIKSQIMHFYFVYIHPYFDVNGRTSRTLSMWYLLNNKSYPYIIFNRSIAFAKKEYEENIIKSRKYGDVTLFLKYMLVQVERELEKEYFVHQLNEKSSHFLSKEDLQMIEYFISMNGNRTVKDLASFYNLYNEHRRVSEIYDQRIAPLLEKDIFVAKGYTKSFIKSELSNFYLDIHPQFLDVDATKVKHLKLEK